MKREGRQHGMVRTCRILPAPYNLKAEPRFVQRLDSAPTAGLFTRVPSKPTNHSKYTSKCGRPRCLCCHMNPACKSKDKTKGTQKLKSNNVFRMIAWRVVDGGPGLKFSGFSATGILEHLGSRDHFDVDDETDDDIANDAHEGLKEMEDSVDGGANNIGNDNQDGDEDEDKMSFSDVGMELELVQAEEEGWCLVGQV